MFLKKVDGPRAITLPDGSVITLADLPPQNTRRWVASRKAAVVRGAIYGLISEENVQKELRDQFGRISRVGTGS